MERIREGEKGYQIFFEDRGEFLYVRIEGEYDSPAISNHYWREIAEKCEELKPNRLFVEEDLRQQVESVADIYEVASEISHRSLSGIRIAFFDTQPDHHEKNIFAELVARNMGLNVRIFDNKDAAMDWLMSEQ